MNVFWSDRLEDLANHLFDQAKSAGPFVSECVVVGSPAVEGWLKQHFLFERRKEQRVLANWEFVHLHQFVNDWLAHKDGETGRRDPKTHPYSLECLRWRIYRILETSTDSEFKDLHKYVGEDLKAAPRRRFGLAGQLARLFDNYQNFRAPMLVDWKDGKTNAVKEGLRWQPALWKALTEDNADSYLAQFCKMEQNIPAEALGAKYRRISIFHISSMSPPYVHFFNLLSKKTKVPIAIYALNPSRGNWIFDSTATEQERKNSQEKNPLEGKLEPSFTLKTPNPLLNGLGKGCQSFLAELLDCTGKESVTGVSGNVPAGNSLLDVVQEQVRSGKEPSNPPIEHSEVIPSIQFHICHGPMREVQILRDQLLAWFDTHSSHQPRHVQVLVADLDAYAPYIDAVFQTERPNAQGAIPYEIVGRPKPGAGPLGVAFLSILRCCESRLTATELMGLLELDGIRDAFGLSAQQIDALRDLVSKSGIRWGADAAHLQKTLGADLDDVATWRRGLDRMLLGYAMGRDEESREARLVDAGKLRMLRSCDGIEGDTVDLLGSLGRFLDSVHGLSSSLATPCGPKEWGERLQSVLDTFFRSTNTTFLEIAEIRRALRGVVQTATAAGKTDETKLPCSVIAAAVEEWLSAPTPSANAAHNAVLFTPLRTMHPMPRPLLYLLGMGEGAFPRPDDRSTFDLMAEPKERRRGDRSRRLDDRLAFLEALLCARERLVISYTGRDPKTNESMPPSTVVAELQQYLDDVFVPTCLGVKPGEKHSYCQVEHRLQAFHPAYFTPKSGLCSYSRSNFKAAEKLVATWGSGQEKPAQDVSSSATASPPGAAGKDTGGAKEPIAIRLVDLQNFFVNPVKMFYTRELQVRLDDPEDGCLADTEVFDPDALENYQLNDLLLKHGLSGEEGTISASLPREMGLVPLSAAGDIHVDQQSAELEVFLGEAWKGRIIRKLLEASGKAVPTVLEPFEMKKDFILTGSIRLVEIDQQRFQICSRYASVKPKDRLKAWIAHLYGHATGHTFTTLVVGGKDGKPKVEEIPPVTADCACNSLKTLIACYLEGRARALPFSPATAYEYASTPQAKGEVAAMAAARKAWHSNYGFGEDKDTYLYQKWGEDGPMKDAGFPGMAKAIWAPFLGHLGGKESKPDGGKEGGEE